MTLFKGMLLFDVAEPAIGKWENQLGYCGMLEVWIHDETGDTITLEPNEDATEEEWECWIHDKESEQWDSLGWGTFKQVDKLAKQWMEKHPNGWK